jgi:hypothetical protein
MRASVAQLSDAGGDGPLFEVVLLAEDALQLPSVAPGDVRLARIADKQLDLFGQPQNARVQVPRDPPLATFSDALWRLRSVFTLVLTEQHHLRAERPAAQHPQLLVFTERAPEVAPPV